MNPEVDIYTETMAKVYADQGHWSKAAEIYRYLVQLEPERTDLADALAEAQRKMVEKPIEKTQRLVPLFQEWIELVMQHEKMEKLKKLRRKL